MRIRRDKADLFLFVLALAILGFLGTARAYPDGAPWDHDGGPGRPDCGVCHFDSAPIRQSPALSLQGLPEQIAPGAAYDLVLRLELDEALIAGFLMRAESQCNVGAGAFSSLDSRTTADGAGVRSTLDGTSPDRDGVAEWRFRWRAPDMIEDAILFYIAANAANGDNSSFGDAIHLLKVEAGAAGARDACD